MLHNRSIRWKLTIWFSLVLIAVTAVTFLAIRLASGTVLGAAIRSYLMGTVQENADKIQYVTEPGDTSANLYLDCGEGFLEIDLDFMDVVNDVYTALYRADGTMLYGENPLSRQTVSLPFTTSHIWSMQVDAVRYELCDLQLSVQIPGDEPLWIRGMVPDTQSHRQLRSITRLSLLLLPVLIALAAFSGYLVADRLLSPIRRMERSAGQISRGDDLKQRLPVGKSRDEVGRLTLAFNRMLDRLERSFETERQFTSDVSHELRTPTAVILAQSEYTLERQRTVEEYTEALQVIHKQGVWMRQLIGDMLDYTRMDQQSQRYPMEPLELSLLVEETVAQLGWVETGVTVTTQIQPGLTISGNALLLGRLVRNLTENACRYSREDGHVAVTLREEGDSVLLSVSDDGVGIAQEEQEKIFDRFYRCDASRSVQGTGLGLPMVRKIAQIHGATVELESQLGQGSTFRVIFKKNPISHDPLING